MNRDAMEILDARPVATFFRRSQRPVSRLWTALDQAEEKDCPGVQQRAHPLFDQQTMRTLTQFLPEGGTLQWALTCRTTLQQVEDTFIAYVGA
jgi:hypothetical protein